MNDDPKRLFETVTGELADLRIAIHAARHLEPTEHDLELIASRIQRSLDSLPPDGSEPDDLDDVDPPRAGEPPDPTREDLAESTPGEKMLDAEVEPEVAGGLTATLLAASAAMVWLRRRAARTPVQSPVLESSMRGTPVEEPDDDERD